MNVQARKIRSSFDSCSKAEFFMSFTVKPNAIFTINTERLQQTRPMVTSL